MYELKDIRVIHIEPTERCNLSCLMCDRNKNGGEVNQYLRDRELSFEVMMDTLDPVIPQLKKVYFCGNYGDPIMSNSLLPILKYLRGNNPDLNLSIITNGSLRPIPWWKELAGERVSARFGIDGLEDTHHLYRQRAKWDIIIRNAKSFIDAGGYAIWDYLVFGHNEHQIEEARQLSKKLGFSEFVVKKTGRFFSNIKLSGKEEHVGLKKPKSKENINKSLQKEEMIKEKYGSIENYLNATKIDCKVRKNREIYISAEGLVFPCCWLAGQLYKWYLPPKSSQIWKFVNKNEININYVSLEDVFYSGFFKKIEKSWSSESVNNGKLKTCALKCGEELDQFGDQFK